jgi:subtilisin family serine protease
MMAETKIDLSHPAITGRSGAGVKVAVIDSGINPWHDHIGRVAGGAQISPVPEGGEGDHIDRLGHGTAVAAVIHERAPDAELYAVKIFDRALATNATTLARAIDWATDHDMRLVNLSLGTSNMAREPVIAEAVDRAIQAGMVIVSVSDYDGKRWLPGSLPGVVGVLLDNGCERTEMRAAEDSVGGRAFRASGYPRPLPAVPIERNLAGISFAVANVSATVALALEGRPEIRSSDEVFSLLS